MLGNAFQPGVNSTTVCAVTASSTFFPIPGNGDVFLLFNSGASGLLIFIESCGGSSGQPAATVTTSLCIPPLATYPIPIARRPDSTGITAIASAAGPTNLYVSVGVQT
jgi:hypothetical protein